MTDHSLVGGLDRTLLLMRDELVAGVSDQLLIEALSGTTVVLVADKQNLRSHSAQAAFVAAAILLSRSGHAVTLLAPDIRLLHVIAPLRTGLLMGALSEVGDDLLPGVQFTFAAPKAIVDLEVRFGDTASSVTARRSLAVHADAWRARLAPQAPRWREPIDVAFGGLLVSSMIAAEVFKIAMRRLRSFAINHAMFDDLFAPARIADLRLAPADTPAPQVLGEFELISGGAIGHAFLYAIANIPGAAAHARVFDDDWYALSNLNRYMLMRLSEIPERKVWHLSRLKMQRLRLEPVPELFHAETALSRGFDSRILVGADHIPARWEAQRRAPRWLGVGATTHWNAMASAHPAGGACAGCLHPHDDPTVAPIPTVAFVSFWAGLMLAAYFVREVAGRPAMPVEQQTFLTPFRPENVWQSTIGRHRDCPLHGRKAA